MNYWLMKSEPDEVSVDDALAAPPFDPADTAPYFETAWRQSFPGELYISDASQLDVELQELVRVSGCPAWKGVA